MSSIYTSTYTPTENTGPLGEIYAPIPGLNTLTLTDNFLADGGTAVINLYLGLILAASGTNGPFFIAIEDISNGTTIITANMGNADSYAGLANISAVYSIPANTKPVLQASWALLGGTGYTQIVVPTEFSFTAQVFPNVADPDAINIAAL